MAKYKKIWNSKEERDEHERRVDETIRHLTELAEKGRAELEAKKRASEQHRQA